MLKFMYHKIQQGILLSIVSLCVFTAYQLKADTSATSVTDRKVIVHVVPWYPPDRSVESAESLIAASEPSMQKRIDEHLLKMKEYAFDAVALDVQVRADWRPGQNPSMAIWQDKNVKAWMDAMQRLAPEMKFCMQLDRKPTPNDTKNWPAVIDALSQAFADHPQYLRENGKPLLLTFFMNESISGAEWNKLLNQTQRKFLVVGNPLENPKKINQKYSRQYVDIDEMNDFIQSFDGVEIPSVGANISWLQQNNETIAPMVAKAGKLLIHGVGCGYYRKKVAFLEPRFDYLDNTWQMAINSQDKYALIYTWNDVAEDTDIYPSKNKDEALLELNSFYAKWFRSGKPLDVTSPLVFVNYPKTNSNRRETKGGENPSYPQMSYWAWVNSSQKLTIEGVGEVTLKKGFNVGLVGQVSPGLPKTFSLHDGNKQILSGSFENPMTDLKDKEDLRYRWAALHRMTK